MSCHSSPHFRNRFIKENYIIAFSSECSNVEPNCALISPGKVAEQLVIPCEQLSPEEERHSVEYMLQKILLNVIGMRSLWMNQTQEALKKIIDRESVSRRATSP